MALHHVFNLDRFNWDAKNRVLYTRYEDLFANQPNSILGDEYLNAIITILGLHHNVMFNYDEKTPKVPYPFLAWTARYDTLPELKDIQVWYAPLGTHPNSFQCSPADNQIANPCKEIISRIVSMY